MLTKKVLSEITAHVKAEYPKEACGFVVMNGRKQEYLPAVNRAAVAEEFAMVSGEDWADAEDRGRVVRFIHSHPGDGCRPIPSPLDVSMCNESGVVWGIMSWPDGEYAEISPANEPLQGRKFVLGGQDCYSLVMAYSALQGVYLPDHRLPYPWWECGENIMQDNLEDDGYKVVDRAPLPGDVIFMQISADVWNHAAVYVGDGLILSHMYGQLSHVCEYNAYFKKVTRCIARHEDMPLPGDLKPWQ